VPEPAGQEINVTANTVFAIDETTFFIVLPPLRKFRNSLPFKTIKRAFSLSQS
jgi:hypothetical protein